MKSVRTYTIVNPHDDYTLEAKCDEVATVAAAVLGPVYAVSRDGWSSPVALFGMEVLDSFCLEEFGCTIEQLLASVLELEAGDLADALSSIVIDRDGLKRFVGDDEYSEDVVARWNEARRTSTTDLREIGASYATAIRQRAGLL